MKLPALEPFDKCQQCKAEMLDLTAVATGLWWCSKCGTLATVADQWVPSGKWISVEERLPDSSRKVLIYTFLGRFVGDYSSGEWMLSGGSFPVGVTHWQELPEGPK